MEMMIEATGIPYTFLRPNFFMQNFVMYQGPTIKGQSAFYLPVGEAKTSFVDVRDVAAVAATVLTTSGHEGKAYDLTGGQALSNSEVASLLSQAIGRDIKYVDITDAAFREEMKGYSAPAGMIDAMSELYHVWKAGYTAAVSPDVERITGRKPIPFERFAREAAPLLK